MKKSVFYTRERNVLFSIQFLIAKNMNIFGKSINVHQRKMNFLKFWNILQHYIQKNIVVILAENIHLLVLLKSKLKFWINIMIWKILLYATHVQEWEIWKISLVKTLNNIVIGRYWIKSNINIWIFPFLISKMLSIF